MNNPWTKWQPIDTAPKDGQMILSLWNEQAVFVAWFDEWRVVTFGREGRYAIHGNYAPFEPKHWLPYSPEQIATIECPPEDE